jgi:CRISPR system Cascade subunit CasE
MYISELQPDVSSARVRNWLRNPYRIHQRLWLAFQGANLGADNSKSPFLYHFDLASATSLQPRILVLSETKPDWTKAFADSPESIQSTATKEFPLGFIAKDAAFRFSLKANPTRKAKDYRSLFVDEMKQFPSVFTPAHAAQYLDGKARLEQLKKTVTKEQRQGLRSKKTGIYTPSEQLSWLARRAAECGFFIESVLIEKSEAIRASKTTAGVRRQIPKIHTVTFSGTLRVTEPDKFRQAYATGIGSAKAFGCGMLLLARL